MGEARRGDWITTDGEVSLGGEREQGDEVVQLKAQEMRVFEVKYGPLEATQ